MADPIYTLRDVSFAYPGEREALRGVTIDIARGEFLAVAGANASGKTTLAMLLAGVLAPSSGELCFQGRPSSSLRSPFEGVSVLFQNPENTFVAPTLEEDVAFGPENLGMPPAEIRRIVDGSLEQVGLGGFALRHPASLSGGQQQLAALAGVLACSPLVLILDEATSYLDDPHRRLVRGLVLRACRERGITLVMITQEADELWDADRLLVLKGGDAVYLGPPGALLGDPAACRGAGLEADALVIFAASLAALGIEAPPGRPTAASLEACLVPRG